MNHKDILKRAWQILGNYRVLWVFGIILGLTTASAGERLIQYSGNRGNRVSETQTTPDMWGKSFQEGWDQMETEFNKLFTDIIPVEWQHAFVTIAIVAGCLILILIVLRLIFCYISRTSLMKMVNEYEETGAKHTVREGFRIGWSRTTWKLFLVDLTISLPAFIVLLIALVIAMLPLLLLASNETTASILGVVLSSGLFLLWIFVTIIIATLISVLLEIFRLACALEDLGVAAAIQRGFALARQNLGGLVLMWLILMGINIGYTFAIIPVVFIVLLVAGVIATVLGLIAAGTVGLVTVPWIAGLAVGLPIFILLMAIPLAFIDGLRQTYISSVWTLTYREMLALESLEPELEDVEALPEMNRQ
jgi:hypothetical protein